MIYGRYPKTQEAYEEKNSTKTRFLIELEDRWFWKIEQKVRMQQNMI